MLSRIVPASSGYRTVSETFPLEIRAQAIAFFYILGTGAGGVIGPWLFGNLITPDVRVSLFYGYLIGAGLISSAASPPGARVQGRAEVARGHHRPAVRGHQGAAGRRRRADFQEEHRLPPTGTVDEDTQVALRVVAIEREQQAEEQVGAATTPPGAAETGRPYTQRGMWAGFTYIAATPGQDRDLDTELEELQLVLRDGGPLPKSELRARVGAKQWGPGRFRQAFNVAVEESRIERDESGAWRVAEEREPASV